MNQMILIVTYIHTLRLKHREKGNLEENYLWNIYILHILQPSTPNSSW